MRNALKIPAAIVCLAAAPSVALAATGGSSRKPLAINCNNLQFKPKKIVLACGDAGSWLSKLKWSSWSGTQASGTGTYNQNNCTPNCVNGHINRGPVKVTLSKPRTCPSQTQRAFKQASLTYTGTRPKGAPARVKFSCPVLPGGY